MKRRNLVFLLLTLVVSVFISSEVLAECPEGKNPVQINTPSGKSKILCIPDAAVQGIENAAEHSGGTIVAATCPCWDDNELRTLDINYNMTCVDQDFPIQTTCKGTNYKGAVIWLVSTAQAELENTCANYSRIDGAFKLKITQDELDACNASLQPYK